jgi:hypothetical protein
MCPFLLWSQSIQISDSTQRTEWVFSTQQEIDQFPSQHPGLTVLDGDVTIEGSNIVNLDSLQQILEIQGLLSIRDCYDLQDLDGLSNLEKCRGLMLFRLPEINSLQFFQHIDSLELGLNISSCGQVNTLEELSGLNYSGSISFYDIPIKDFKGLESLDSLPFGIWISGLDSLEDIQVLEEVNYTGHSLRLNGLGSVERFDLSQMEFDGDRIDINMNDHLKSFEFGAIPDTLLQVWMTYNASLKHFVFPGVKVIRLQLMMARHDSLEFFSFPDLKYSDDIKIENNKSLLHFSFPSLNFSEQIYVNDNNSLLHLDGFSQTDSIHDAFIERNRSLEDVSGISNLSAYTRYVGFENNINLKTIEGFNDLINLYSVNISGNSKLEKIIGFNNVKIVNYDFKLENNYALKEFDAFESLDTIKRDLEIVNMDSLKIFPGLPSLKYVKENFIVKDMASIPDFSGMNSLSEIGVSFKVQENSNLISLVGLEQLQYVGQSIELEYNPQLNSLQGLNSLTEVGDDFNIKGGNFIENLEGLEHLKTINGDFNFYVSSNINSLKGLESLETVEGGLYVMQLPNIQNLQGLNSLKNVGSLYIKNNANLSSLSGLDSLYRSTSFLKIENNSSLLGFHGMEHFKYANRVLINNNDRIQNFFGLDQLQKVTSTLQILGNDRLESFEGLGSLVVVGDDLEIENNDSLQSIDELGYLSIGDYLRIINNPLLSYCSVAGICEFMEQNNDSRYTFAGNAEGCNSDEQVDSVCAINNVYDSYAIPAYFPYGYYRYTNWNILVHKKHVYPHYGITHTYDYDGTTEICGQKYAVLSFPNSTRQAYIRSDENRAWYRVSADCEDEEYLFYDFSLELDDKVWVGWEDEVLDKDQARFQVVDIRMIENNGLLRKQITLDYIEEDGAYSGQLTWVDGVGSLEHPFYPFALMSDHFKRKNELLCMNNFNEVTFQNPPFTSCDTSYTAIDEINESGFLVYPNPFKDHLEIRLNGEKIENIQMYSITGQELPLQWTQNTQTAQIRILEEGVYGVCLLRILFQDQTANIKLMRF